MRALLTLLVVALATPFSVRADGPIDFNRDVRPLLANQCFACHGPDEETREADLRLDVAADAQAERSGSPAIVPGMRQKSELYLRITSSDPDLRMPPADSGHSLSQEQIEILGRWIDSGAEYALHWSFTPPNRPALPPVEQQSWIRSPIDTFILAGMESHELSPNPEADGPTLLRRLALDLTGLPPSDALAAEFLQSDLEEGYEIVVDRLIASEHFGEHWARMWLDLARYADTKGYEKDQPRDIWRYRDWVIDALNRDMTFDQFTIEQLAGDLLPQPTTDQLLATAFHRNTMTNDEGGTDNEEFRLAAVKDRVDTTIQVWMGLTMGCAKCHSHKYDPITHEDYYRFLALFNQTEDADRSDDAPRVATPTTSQQEQLAQLKQQLAEAQSVQPSNDETRARAEALEKQLQEFRDQLPTTPIMRDLAEKKRRKTHLHLRGNFLQPGDEVSPGLPAAFAEEAESASDRLAVAHWLLNDSNPLTARVAVNRVWARIFGRGFVETEEDFGTQGMLPSHPELLDWMAVEFRESQAWSLKALCKSIVMSATYRQAAAVDEKKREQDPENRWLSRSPRVRLAAEAVRDQALAAAGLLSRKVGGPSVMPPQPGGIWTTTYSTLKWETSAGEDRYRRGLYTFLRRTAPYPSMLTFDAGSREVCMVRRVRTNTPLQALVTMNDPVFVEAAGGLAQRMWEANPATRSAQLDCGFRRVLIRPPRPEELERLERVHESTVAHFQQQQQDAAQLLKEANLDDVAAEQVAELAALTVIGNILLNLDEAMMRP